MSKKQLIADIAALLPAHPPGQIVFAAEKDGIAARVGGETAAFLAFRFLSGKHKPHGANFAFEPAVSVADNPIDRTLARLSEHLPQIRPRSETAFNFCVYPSELRERDAVFKNINIAVYPHQGEAGLHRAAAALHERMLAPAVRYFLAGQGITEDILDLPHAYAYPLTTMAVACKIRGGGTDEQLRLVRENRRKAFADGRTAEQAVALMDAGTGIFSDGLPIIRTIIRKETP